MGYPDPGRNAEAIGRRRRCRWFRTGDVGRLDGDGGSPIIGRIKDLIIRGGENISAAEVEPTLEAHPEVRQAVAVGDPDERLGETGLRLRGLRAGRLFDLAACRSWFADQGLARFKTPERVVVVAELPVLAAGKIDRAAIRTRAASFSGGSLRPCVAGSSPSPSPSWWSPGATPRWAARGAATRATTGPGRSSRRPSPASSKRVDHSVRGSPHLDVENGGPARRP